MLNSYDRYFPPDEPFKDVLQHYYNKYCPNVLQVRLKLNYFYNIPPF